MQEHFWGYAYTTEMNVNHGLLCQCIRETHTKLSDLIIGNIQIHLLLISEPGLHYDDLFLSNSMTVFLVWLVSYQHMKHNMLHRISHATLKTELPH